MNTPSTPEAEVAFRDYVASLDIDLDALRAKYATERNKRLRLDGNQQYVEVTAEFSRYVDDPYISGQPLRMPLYDAVDVAVIGGGFGGLLAGARLRQAGLKNIRMIDKAGDFGGTWYWNRYPGAMCDVESYCYLPLLEELNYIPQHKYAYGPEILAHHQRIADKFGLYDDACFCTAVTELRWDDAQDHWQVHTDQGDLFTARFVVMANGPLNRPKLPGIPGINDFKGFTFHTSRWDYNYTGGNSEGGLTGLRDKRVGVIGTGATAVQCVPHLGEWAKQLYVFQRTPSSVDARNNHPTDPAWAADLQPGWQQRRMDNFNALVNADEQEIDLVSDGWTQFAHSQAAMLKRATDALGRPLSMDETLLLVELNDHQQMNNIRQRVDAIVTDGPTAAALKPWYRQLCKRPCFHDDYLATFNRANVQLVDTQGRGVDRLTEHSVVVGDRAYEVDCLIFATGFEVGTAYTRRAGYEIYGRAGRRLTDHWATGMRTLHGVQTHGFPNCFFLGFTQTAFTVNLPHALNEQAKHIAYIISQVDQLGKRVAEATTEAEHEYVDFVHSLAAFGQSYYAECTPGYYNSEGQEGNPNGFFAEMFTGVVAAHFFDKLKGWRTAGELDGLALR